MIPRVPSLLALFLPLRCLFGSLSYAQRKGEEVCSLLATVATSCCPCSSRAQALEPLFTVCGRRSTEQPGILMETPITGVASAAMPHAGRCGL